ncbi:hypothetical protein AAMO2058_001455800 [Amorphochlora amoebiformis]
MTSCEFCKEPFLLRRRSPFIYSNLASIVFWTGIIVLVHYRKCRAGRLNAEGVMTLTLMPMFLYYFYVCMVVNIIEIITCVVVPLAVAQNNSWRASIIHSTIHTADNFLSMCVVVMLLSQGLGRRTLSRSVKVSSVCSLTLLLLYLFEFRRVKSGDQDSGHGVGIALNGSLFASYLSIYVFPTYWVFRRPALNGYLLYLWTLHALFLISHVLLLLHNNFAYCVFLTALVQGAFNPLIIYTTLLKDSLYWQGKWYLGNEKRKYTMTSNIRSPLSNTSLNPEAAICLARAMDEIERVPLLNHAMVRIKTNLVNDPGLTTKGRSVGFQRSKVVLGAGSYSRVYRGVFKGKSCAIKMMFTPELTPDIIDNVCSEAALLGSLKHKNVVEIIGVCVYPPSVCMVMELCSKGSVFNLVHNKSRCLPVWLVDKICLETATAVSFLHSHNPCIIHLDIKASNLLMDSNYTVKLADLELARRVCSKNPLGRGGRGLSGQSYDSSSTHSHSQSHTQTQTRTTSTTHTYDAYEVKRVRKVTWVVPDTINWTAPELLCKERTNIVPTSKADVYSLAMTFYEIYSRKIPYEDWENDRKDRPELTVEEAIIAGSYRPEIPLNMPDSLKSLIEQGWASDPQQRPTAQDLYNECLRVMKRNRGRNKAEGMDSKSFQSDSKRIQSDSKRIQSDSKRIQSDSKRIQSDSKILKASQYIGQESQGSSRPTTTHASLTQESIAQGSIAQGSIAQDPYHRDLWDLSVENKGYM